MADEAPAPISADVAEAPAPFTLESAFTEAQQAVEPAAADAPTAETPDSKTEATTEPDSGTDEKPSGEEPAKSNRQLGKEAYERGLKEGRETAEREARDAAARADAERQATGAQREFDQLLDKAQAGDLQAAEQVVSLLRTNRATQAAILQGRNAVLTELGTEVASSISKLDGADVEARDALMRAPSVAEYGNLAFSHGRRIEKALWEPEIARRDATIEQLRGQLAARSPSPEAASGLRTNGSESFDGTWEGALRLAQAAHTS